MPMDSGLVQSARRSLPDETSQNCCYHTVVHHILFFDKQLLIKGVVSVSLTTTVSFSGSMLFIAVVKSVIYLACAPDAVHFSSQLSGNCHHGTALGVFTATFT